MTGDQALLRTMSTGVLEVEGRLRGSSNAALRVTCRDDEGVVRAVYKPLQGERPLWDFDHGTLGLREVAAYVIDRALGWGLVPPTVWIEDGPWGPGSLQAWIDTDPDDDPVRVVPADEVPAGWHVVAEGEGTYGEHVCLTHEDSVDLQRLCALDVVLNNADRKGGHVLRPAKGSLVGIDHGLTFHVEDKARTVLWGWAGAPLDRGILQDLRDLAAGYDEVAVTLEGLLSGAEIRATHRRLERLIASGSYPEPDGAWPALPWPAM